MFDLGTRRAIRKVDTDISDVQREVADLREVVRGLVDRLEKEALVVEALVGLLSEKGGITQEDLLERVRRVEDEKISAAPKTCHRCRRALSPRHHRCIYCGEERPVESVADLL